MKITGIRRQRRNGQRVNLYVDGEYRFSLPAEVAARARLLDGTEIDEAGLATLIRDAAAWSAREAALRLLSVRARSRAELRRRLLARGIPHDETEASLDQLQAAGLIDDLDFSRQFARERIASRPRGRTALLSELQARGVDGQTAAAAIDSVLVEEDVDEVDLARRAAKKFRRRRGEPAITAKRRLFGLLARRGFSRETALRVAAEEIPRPE